MNNEFGKYLLPLVAVVVILQSVVLVNSIQGDRSAEVKSTEPVNNQVKVIENRTESFDMVFGVETKNMQVGKKYSVDLSMLSKDENKVGTVDLYVKYDPSAFEVSNLGYDSKLQKPNVLLSGEKKGMMVVNYYSMDPSGFLFSKAEHYSLITFDVIPKKEGNFEFEVSTGNVNDGSVTMILDNNTKKEMLFTSNKLTVNVTK